MSRRPSSHDEGLDRARPLGARPAITRLAGLAGCALLAAAAAVHAGALAAANDAGIAARPDRAAGARVRATSTAQDGAPPAAGPSSSPAPHGDAASETDDARRARGAGDVAFLARRLSPRRHETIATDEEIAALVADLDAGPHVVPLIRLSHLHPERLAPRLVEHFAALPRHAEGALCLLAIAGPDTVRLVAARRLEDFRAPGPWGGLPDEESFDILSQLLRSDVDVVAARAARLANRLGWASLLPDMIDALYVSTPGRRVRTRPIFGFTRAQPGTGATGLGEIGLRPDVFGLNEGARLGTWRRSWWYRRGDQRFRDAVHDDLLALARLLASDDVRTDPRELGWDEARWFDWYVDELVPDLERRERAWLRSLDAGGG